MGRKVTCQICKNKGDSDMFYKVTSDKGVNKYYCNREEFEKRENAKIERYEMYKYIAEEVLGYKEGQIVPPSMVKRIEKLNEFYQYEVIKDAFYSNKDTIQYWISVKDFKSEYGMASYVMAIIEGNINDSYKKWNIKKETENKVLNAKVDIDLMVSIDMDTPVVKKKEKDSIMSFLEEDEI